MTRRGQQNGRSPDTTALYAWLSRDQDGIEGIIQGYVAGEDVVFAFVATDMAKALALRDVAQYAATKRGFPAKLVRFQRAEEIDSVGPD